MSIPRTAGLPAGCSWYTQLCWKLAGIQLAESSFSRVFVSAKHLVHGFMLRFATIDSFVVGMIVLD
jgi:hypothetical protein